MVRFGFYQFCPACGEVERNLASVLLSTDLIGEQKRLVGLITRK